MSRPTTTTQAIAFAIPALSGKTDTDRIAMRSCWQGDRSAAYESSRRRLGITNQTVWIQQTPNGDVGVVHLGPTTCNGHSRAWPLGRSLRPLVSRALPRRPRTRRQGGIPATLEHLLDFRS
jgi:hypothetical protein